MKKELNPALFEEGFGDSRRSLPSLPEYGAELASLGAVAEGRRLEKRFENLASETRAKMDEMARQMNSRNEGANQRISQVEAGIDALAQDLRAKYSHLTSKVTERNLMDMKTQALVDRNTQLMRQFEMRVGQLQKVVEEQEFQILNYQAALEEARRELAKLKKL